MKRDDAIRKGNDLYEARIAAGLSIKEASKLTDVPFTTINCWERGERVPPVYVKKMYLSILSRSLNHEE